MRTRRSSPHRPWMPNASFPRARPTYHDGEGDRPSPPDTRRPVSRRDRKRHPKTSGERRMNITTENKADLPQKPSGTGKPCSNPGPFERKEPPRCRRIRQLPRPRSRDCLAASGLRRAVSLAAPRAREASSPSCPSLATRRPRGERRGPRWSRPALNAISDLCERRGLFLRGTHRTRVVFACAWPLCFRYGRQSSINRAVCSGLINGACGSFS